MLEYNEFNLTLVRHGQSTINANPDLMGQESETPLSDKGESQAVKLGNRLALSGNHIDIVYSSNYKRAYDTASIALGVSGVKVHSRIIEAPELREYHAGDWTGASRAETLTTEVKNRMGAMGHGFLPPKGESLHQVQRRASLWLEDNILYNSELIAQATALRETHDSPLEIYCFSHGMTIKSLLQYIMGFDQSFTWKVMIENTSLTKLSFGKDGWKLICTNDCSHL